MIIPIDDNYRLMADVHCWHIQKIRTRTKDGKQNKDWQSFKWFNSVDQAITCLGNLLVRTSDVETLADALETVQRVSTTLSQALTPQCRVIQEIRKEAKA